MGTSSILLPKHILTKKRFEALIQTADICEKIGSSETHALQMKVIIERAISSQDMILLA